MQSQNDKIVRVIKQFKARELDDLRDAITNLIIDAGDNTASHILDKLNNAQCLNLVTVSGREGCYPGGNQIPGHFATIQPENFLDFIIRSALDDATMRQHNRNKIQYINSANVIWLGSIVINERIQEEQTTCDSDDFVDTFVRAYSLHQAHPQAPIVFNVLHTIYAGAHAEAIGHFNTFILKPVGNKPFNLIHIDPRFQGDVSIAIKDTFAKFIETTLEQVFQSRVNYTIQHPRYNQSAYSCGPSVAQELLDLLNPQHENYDSFTGQSVMLTAVRRYDELSPNFVAADDKPLTREDFMRLLHLYLISKHPVCQRSLMTNPELFPCYLYDPDNQNSFSIPASYLEEYFRHWQNFTAPLRTSFMSISENPVRLVNGNTQLSNSGNLEHREKLSNSTRYFDIRVHNVLRLFSEQGNLNKQSLIKDLVFIGATLVFFAGVVGACIALSALLANPLALVMIQALSLSVAQFGSISGAIGTVGAGFVIGTFFAPPMKNGGDAPQACQREGIALVTG